MRASRISMSVACLCLLAPLAVAKPAPADQLRLDMRKLWEDHITYTRNYIISALADLPDKDAVAARLLRNQDDIGAAVATYYGADAGKKLAALLRGKNPTVLRGTKMAVRMVQQMSWDVSNDYLMAKSSEALFLDPERGRSQGLTQFLDEKSYRPGLSGYKRQE